MTHLDRQAERWVVDHRAGWLDPIFKALSVIGGYGIVWLALGLVLAAVLRRPRVFLWVLAAYVTADLLATGLKAAIGRHRPHYHPLVSVPHTNSFPSGHAATSFACAAVIARLVPRLAVPVFVLAAAIAYSRVYLGVHYPLDVLGGAVLGLLVARALRWLSEARRGSPRSRPGG